MNQGGVASVARAALIVAVIGVGMGVPASCSRSDDASQPRPTDSVEDVQDTVQHTADTVEAVSDTTEVVANSVAFMPAVISTQPADWELTFEDQFVGNSLSSSWTTCYWWQVDGGCTIASNDELEWYRPEGARVADGVLRLEASANPQVSTDGVALPYRSGMASTGPPDDNESAAGFSFTFGYVEATVRLPDGAGTWPAVWLLSADRTSLPEIDILEHYGNEPTITSWVHQRADGERRSQRIEATLVPTADGWHRVGVLWTDERVEFYLDDVLTGIVDDPQLVPQTPMYLIVNLALGGRAGPVDDQALPQHFDIDRIQVWQLKEST